MSGLSESIDWGWGGAGADMLRAGSQLDHGRSYRSVPVENQHAIFLRNPKNLLALFVILALWDKLLEYPQPGP